MYIRLSKGFAKWEKIKGQKDFTRIKLTEEKLERKREDFM
jgi:hypothetical protein